MDAIDDIMIANNIANSANGDKAESYNYLWTWEDTADEIHRNLLRLRSHDSASLSIFSGAQSIKPKPEEQMMANEPMSIFRLSCCAVEPSMGH
jgi:hypothetical protein